MNLKSDEFDVKYRAEKKHGNAVALSRQLKVLQCQKKTHDKVKNIQDVDLANLTSSLDDRRLLKGKSKASKILKWRVNSSQTQMVF